MGMHQFLYKGRILPLPHLPRKVSRVLRPTALTLLVGALPFGSLLFGAGGSALAQPGDITCQGYAARCQGHANTPICTQLRQRCGSGAAGGTYIQAPTGNKPDMPQLDTPTDMPDCGPNEEMVMVPTCQCATPPVAGNAPDAGDACAACTSDGMRMECQPAH